LAKTDQATQNATADKAGQTVYAQVKSQINNLDKKGKQRILQLLQKSLQQAAPAKQAAPDVAGGMSKAGATAAATPTKTAAAKPDVAGGMSKAGATAANAPADTTAAPTAPGATAANAPADTTAAPTAPAAPGQEPAAKPKRTRNRRTAATPAAQPTQAEIDADRERLMGTTTDSIIRTQPSLAETLMKAINEEKRRMIAEGKISIFRQYH
jgi:hypothetical protein